MSTNRVRIKIVNPLGLHLRAAQVFVRIAEQFQSDVSVSRDGKSADGKSILDLILLCAASGESLEIEAKGPDSDAAIHSLISLIASGFDHDQGKN